MRIFNEVVEIVKNQIIKKMSKLLDETKLNETKI